MDTLEFWEKLEEILPAKRVKSFKDEKILLEDLFDRGMTQETIQKTVECEVEDGGKYRTPSLVEILKKIAKKYPKKENTATGSVELNTLNPVKSEDLITLGKNLKLAEVLFEMRNIWPTNTVTNKEADDITLLAAMPFLIETEEDKQEFLRKMRNDVADHSRYEGLKSLADYILSAFEAKSSEQKIKRANDAVIQKHQEVQVAQRVKKQEEAEEAFERLFNAWPITKGEPNKERWKYAFYSEVKKRGLQDVIWGCDAYIFEKRADNVDVSRNFSMSGLFGLYQGSVFGDLIERGETESKPENIARRSYFTAAYSFYPNFKGKDKPYAEDNSWINYRCNVPMKDALEFFVACKLYARLRANDIEASVGENDEDYQNKNDSEDYNKSFSTFTMEWKSFFIENKPDALEALRRFTIDPLFGAMTERNIPYDLIITGDRSIASYHCTRMSKYMKARTPFNNAVRDWLVAESPWVTLEDECRFTLKAIFAELNGTPCPVDGSVVAEVCPTPDCTDEIMAQVVPQLHVLATTPKPAKKESTMDPELIQNAWFAVRDSGLSRGYLLSEATKMANEQIPEILSLRS